jgi:hypothetical protein
MKRISRRQFLKGSGYAALGGAAASNGWLLQGCGSLAGSFGGETLAAQNRARA